MPWSECWHLQTKNLDLGCRYSHEERSLQYEQSSGTRRHDPCPRNAQTQFRSRAGTTERAALRPELDVLRHGRVDALAVRDVEVEQVVRGVVEEVRPVRHVLEW